MARVRYIVDNVSEAVAFYVSKLGFEVDQQYGEAIAILVRGDLELLVSGPLRRHPGRCGMARYPIREAGPDSS